MKEKNIISVLLFAVALLAVGEGYLVYQNTRLTSALNGSPASSALSSGGATASAPLSVSSTLAPLSGTVAAIGGAGFDMRSGATSSAPMHITVSSDTSVVAQGALKERAAQDADMQAFHAYSQSLLQDPQKNRLALEHLVAPSAYTEQSIGLSGLSAGEKILVFGERQTDGTIVAVKVVALPSAQ